MDETFVPKFYHMNPQTEDLLFDGTELKDGMVVLIEHSDLRGDLDTISIHPSHLERALKWNRWTTVSAVVFDEEKDQVLFIATYEDGTKRKFIADADYAWFVKKDSIPVGEPLAEVMTPEWEKDLNESYAKAQPYTDDFGNPYPGLVHKDLVERTADLEAKAVTLANAAIQQWKARLAGQVFTEELKNPLASDYYPGTPNQALAWDEYYKLVPSNEFGFKV